MAFPDPSVPIATCEAPDCAGCSVAHSIHCHFSRADPLHSYLICFPVFLVGGAGALAAGLVPLLIWIGIIILFFGFIEIRVMCSHCPHYAEEGSSLRCWANYGSPKLWKYRPGPMSTLERVVFFAGLLAVFGYPLAFLVADGLWFLLALYLLLTAGFAVTLNRSFCSQCMNFACPLNSVPQHVRVVFWECNPRVGTAWNAAREKAS